jgi:ferredoxin
MESKSKKRIGILYFSPTNTTKKICNAIALGMGANDPIELNLTKPEFRKELISNANTILENISFLIVGSPVYEGKLPIQVIESLNALKVEEKECAIVVVYGNRDYGIAARQMAEILIEKRFKIKAAGMFIGEHSYSRFMPIAIGRPNKNDLELAFNFGKKCISTSGFLTTDDIPRQLDWISKSKKYQYPAKSQYISENCTHCGICAELCPVGIISPENGDFINKKLEKNCTGCMACVSNCETNARIIKVSFFTKLILQNVLKKATVQSLEPLTIVS